MRGYGAVGSRACHAARPVSIVSICRGPAARTWVNNSRASADRVVRECGLHTLAASRRGDGDFGRLGVIPKRIVDGAAGVADADDVSGGIGGDGSAYAVTRSGGRCPAVLPSRLLSAGFVETDGTVIDVLGIRIPVSGTGRSVLVRKACPQQSAPAVVLPFRVLPASVIT